MELNFDTRVWAASIITAALVYTAVSLAFGGELNIVETVSFIFGFAVAWAALSELKYRYLNK